MDIFAEINEGLSEASPLSEAEAAEIADLSAEYRRRFEVNSGRRVPSDGEGSFAGLLAKVDQLAEGDLREARRLVEAASWFNVDEIERDGFLDRVKKGLKSGVKITSLREIWAAEAAKAREARAPTPDDLGRFAAEAAQAQAEEKARETERLWSDAEPLATLPDILADAVETAHLAGVVGEDEAIAAHYLAMSSRVLAEDRVLSTCGTGQSSTGKSHVAEKVEKMMPPECVVSITSGSPRALIYMVADDPVALKHKVVVVRETAGLIAGSDADDTNPSTAILRELLTRGRADYPYVEKNDQGQLVTKKLVAEGPISLVTTSARDNLDPEMQNRIIAIPGNESPKATRAIQIAQIRGDAEKTLAEARQRLTAHLALQRWLQSAAPIKAVIPDDLRQSILAALDSLPDTVRTRRDVPAFLLAVRASAALHMAQRRKDADGRVIATIDDYKAAHGALDRFIALEYSSKLKPAELLVLAAIEKLIEKDQAVRLTREKGWTAGTPFPFGHIPASEPKAPISYDQIMTELNMKSRKTLASRVQALKRAGAIAFEKREIGQPVVWELLMAATVVNRARHGRFMPPPDEIEKLLGDPAIRDAKIAEVVAAAGLLPDWAVEEGEGELEGGAAETKVHPGRAEEDEEEDEEEEEGPHGKTTSVKDHLSSYDLL